MRKFLLLTLVSAAVVAPATATAAPTRAQYAAVARAAQESDGSGVIPVATVARGGERCWSGEWHERYWHAFGHTIGALYVYQNGWCGTGHRITRDFGWHSRTYSWGPYCMTNVDWNGGSWEVYPSWKHAQLHGTLGVSYPWGCGGLRSGTSSLRIAANGYWDGRYN